MIVEPLDVPVAPHLDAAAAQAQPVGRRQRANVAIDGARREKVAQREIAFELGQIDRRIPRRARAQRLDLAREMQRAPELRVEERLLAEPVARDEHLAVPHVVDGEREHALEHRHAVGAVLFVGVHDRFGVRRRAEDVAARDEPRPKRAVVVDLAVEDDPVRAVFVANRLRAAFAIDDREAPVPERRDRIREDALSVGAAVLERRRHAADRPAHAGVEHVVHRHHATDATHMNQPIRRR